MEKPTTPVEDIDLAAYLLAERTYPLIDTHLNGRKVSFAFAATPEQIDSLARDFDAGAALPARDVLAAFRSARKAISRVLGVRR